MIQAIGIDMVLVDRVEKLVRTYPDQLNRIYTRKELHSKEKTRLSSACLAELFAAKEAVFKVLGTGWQKGMSWTDIEINGDQVVLTGKAEEIAKELNINQIQISVSSTEKKAVAQAFGRE